MRAERSEGSGIAGDGGTEEEPNGEDDDDEVEMVAAKHAAVKKRRGLLRGSLVAMVVILELTRIDAANGLLFTRGANTTGWF